MEDLELLGLVEPIGLTTPANAIVRVPFSATFRTKRPSGRRGSKGKIEVMVLLLVPRATHRARGPGTFNMTCKILSENDCMPVGAVASATLTRFWKGRLVCEEET